MKDKKPSVFIKARFNDRVSKVPDEKLKITDYEKYSNMEGKHNETAYYREENWTIEHKWYWYVTRDDACLKANITLEEYQKLFDWKNRIIDDFKEKYIKNNQEHLINTFQFKEKLYRSEEFKKYINTIKELNRETDNTGLWDSNGAIKQKDREKKLKEFSQIKNEQLVFEQVFSLDRAFMDKHGAYTPEQFYNVISAQMPNILKNYGFKKPENINWNVAFHVNTDNFHCHLAFWEKKPLFISNDKEKGKVWSFKRIGELEPETFIKNSYFIEKEFIEDQKLKNHIYELRNKFFNEKKPQELTWDFVKEVNSYLQKGLKQNLDFISLQKLVRRNKIKYYNSKNTDQLIKEKINDLSLKLIENNKNMKETFDSFSFALKTKQDELINLSESYWKTKYPKLYNAHEKDYQILLNEYEIKEGETLYNIFNFYDENMYGKDGLFSRIGNKLIQELNKNYVESQFEDNFILNSKWENKIKKKAKEKKIFEFYKKSFFYSINSAEKEALFKYSQLIKNINNNDKKIEFEEKKQTLKKGR